MLQIKTETANIWEYIVGNNAIVANFVCLWKARMKLFATFPHICVPLKE